MNASLRPRRPLTWTLALGLFGVACSDDAKPDEMSDDTTGGEDSTDAAASESGVADDSTGGAALDFSGFDAAVEAYLQQAGLEGATAAVVHRDLGVVHTAAYGTFELDRVILLASASKTLSVGVLIRLHDQGLLDLDDPLSSYVSGWMGSRDFSLAQMLSNSSGMVGLLDDPTYAPYLCQYLTPGTLSDCAAQIYGADDAADIVPPDTQFRYGGGQWQLAGGVAELVTGKTWTQLVQETYVDTCGTTSLGYGNQFQQAVLEGGMEGAFSYPPFFEGDPANLMPSDNPNVEGGGYTNVLDYAELLGMQLREGECSNGTRVLSAEGVARMQQDRILDAYGGSTGVGGGLDGYGLGWWVDREHPGVVADPGAYGAVPWLDHARGYAAVILLEGRAEDSAIKSTTQPELEAVFDGLE